jgi:hypothetical protein
MFGVLYYKIELKGDKYLETVEYKSARFNMKETVQVVVCLFDSVPVNWIKK